MSEEQNFWQMGQEQQLCAQKTHASLHTSGCHLENITTDHLQQGEKGLVLTRGVRTLC